MSTVPEAFWSVKAADLLQELQSSSQGLTDKEAKQRLLQSGPNRLTHQKRSDWPSLLLNQFKSPLIIILLFAAVLSLFLHDRTDAIIILSIVLISGLLGFWQEKGATNAVEKLLSLVRIKAKVLRDGASVEIPMADVVPGDVVDFPEMTIAIDRVDSEMVDHPRRWDIKAIRKFMITFGLVSSVFDYLTFGALLIILHATQDQFRTGWFLESVVSAALIVLVIRSRKPFFKSRPSRYLLMATLLVVVITLIFPFTSLGKIFEFNRLPISFFLLIGIIVVCYIITAQIVKTVFYKSVRF